jgi:serine/threonine-protein kinase 24/25/MST4
MHSSPAHHNEYRMVDDHKTHHRISLNCAYVCLVPNYNPVSRLWTPDNRKEKDSDAFDIIQMKERSFQSGNQSAQDAISRLTGAWSQLDAVDPESSYQLIHTLVDRLQKQPQLHSIVSPIPAVKVPEFVSKTNIKPSLSGPTLTGSSPVPKALTRPKRANSISSNKKKRNSRQSDEFGIDGVDDVSDKSTPASNQLADVLYGRWLEGLRGRWGVVAK